MKIFTLLFLSLTFLLGYENFSYQFLQKKPNSVAKDYYLYKLYEEKKLVNIQKKDIYHMSAKMKKVYEHFHPRPSLKQKYKTCFKDIPVLKMSRKCQLIRLKSTYFAKNLTKKERKKLALFFKKEKPSLAMFLHELNLQKPLAYIIAKKDTKNFLFFYKNNDLYLPASFLKAALKSPINKAFFINTIYDRTYPKLRSSLLKLKPADVKGSFAFLLSIDALSLGHKKTALAFMKKASLTMPLAEEKDNALFWLYLLTKNVDYLTQVVNSKSLNIYTLYARELLNMPLPEVLTPKPSKITKDFAMQDPFLWQSLRKKILKTKKEELKSLAKKFYFKNTLAVYTFIMSRSDDSFYFISPNFASLEALDVKQQAIILALARQESLFIPTAISSSFALGTMQFMPFLAKAMAKQMKLKNFQPDDLFNQKLSYIFANKHINYLKTYLKNPLFIAYAYNGGIGFTRRMLKKEHMFKKGEYEPFLSMELVPYAESRVYGKKVLANYLIYLNLLNERTKISQLFDL